MSSFLLAQASSGASSSPAPTETIVESVLSSLGILWNVALAVIVIIVFWLLGKLIGARIVKGLRQAKGETLYPDMEDLIRRLAFYGSITTGLAVALQFIFNLDFIQVIGFFGLGISLAFKDLVANLIAGTVVIIQNRFHIGDFIKIGKDIMGKVMEIQTRATILKGIDGTEIIVPNADLISKTVTSYTAHNTRRKDFVIGISFESDLKKALQICDQTMQEHEHVLKKPKPKAIVQKVGESAIEVSVRFWFDPKDKSKSWIAIKSELIAEIKARFDEEGIIIPFPIRTLVQKGV